MTPQKYQVGTLWLSANSPVNLKIDNDLMRSSVLKPFMRWKITILNTLYFMKYIIFYGLIGTMINKTLAKKNAYFYFSKELSTKYVKKFKMAVSPYVESWVVTLWIYTPHIYIYIDR